MTIFQRYWKYLRLLGFKLEWRTNREGFRTHQYTKLEGDRIMVLRLCSDEQDCNVTCRFMNPDNPEDFRWRETKRPIPFSNLNEMFEVLKVVVSWPNEYKKGRY